MTAEGTQAEVVAGTGLVAVGAKAVSLTKGGPAVESGRCSPKENWNGGGLAAEGLGGGGCGSPKEN
jgi:hypothetical protein